MAAKRIFDFLVSSLLLLIMSPLFLAIAALVRIDSPGPAFFRQERVGQFGRTFRIRKFRTMRHAPSPNALQVTVAGDPRVTRVGAVLRRLKIDELPQLIDVLGGSMSLVGPRPEVPRYVSMWPDDARAEVLSVRPGITDPTAIEFFDESRLLADSPDPDETYIKLLIPRKLAGYRSYVRTQSFGGDLRILLGTAARILGGR